MKRFNRNSFLIILSAPSGGGKTTICRAILDSMPEVHYSISYTTRTPRSGEVNGESYFFISEEEFRNKISENDFLEYARVHGNLYGTSRSYILERFAKGYNVIMDIDVQGAESIFQSCIDCITIFLLPPSMEVLRSRLVERGLDDNKTIDVRLNNAEKEIEMIPKYQYLVINDDLQCAINEVKSIIMAEQNKSLRYKDVSSIFYGGSK